MKAFLLYPDRDFDPEAQALPNEADLVRDIELTVLIDAMGGGESFLWDVARQVVLGAPGNSAGTILYRQQVMRDCIRNESVVRELHALATEARERRRREHVGVLGRYPSTVLSGAVNVMGIFVDVLKRLKSTGDAHSASFESAGFRRFFSMLAEELDDDYFALVDAHLKQLKFREGVLVSASLGKGGKGRDYLLRTPQERDKSWFKRLTTPAPKSFTIKLHPRDQAGARALSELRDRGINRVADALAQSAQHVQSFFEMLRFELGFYVACLNLHDRLGEIGAPVCLPTPVEDAPAAFSCRKLHDVSLTLTMGRAAIGNTVNADGKPLVIVTGANKGGKSTFLRSVGLAEMMMHAGMFVGAEAFSSSLVDGVFTHYKREEDETMESGKFDEELVRMSAIADHVTPGSIVLFNESFAATNEREGAAVARQIVDALLDSGARVVFVTHMYALAHGFEEAQPEDVLFLRAERGEDGSRSFRLREAPPLETSYGEDLYEQVFGQGKNRHAPAVVASGSPATTG